MGARSQVPDTFPDAAGAGLLLATLDAMAANIAVLDEHGTIILVNASWRDFGAANGLVLPDDGVGSSYLNVCGKAAADGDPAARRARDAIVDISSGRVPSVTFEYPCHSPEKKRWFIFRASRFERGGESYVVVAHDDITARHEVEDSLRASHHALESFNLAVSHDLRAPLRRIEELSSIAGDEAHTLAQAEDLAAILARIRNEAARARMLANDLLDLSRVGSARLLRTPLDVTQLARDAADALRASQPERRVHLFIDPGMRAFADARLVRIIFANLLENAWKFTKDKPDARIDVTSTREAGQACFFVRDNGIGFDAQDATRLFQPFTRLDAARTYEGTGVGLAVVRRAIERHGGIVQATGAPGVGATFRFTLGSESMMA